jgi:hypothetical protein
MIMMHIIWKDGLKVKIPIGKCQALSRSNEILNQLAPFLAFLHVVFGSNGRYKVVAKVDLSPNVLKGICLKSLRQWRANVFGKGFHRLEIKIDYYMSQSIVWEPSKRPHFRRHDGVVPSRQFTVEVCVREFPNS